MQLPISRSGVGKNGPWVKTVLEKKGPLQLVIFLL